MRKFSVLTSAFAAAAVAAAEAWANGGLISACWVFTGFYWYERSGDVTHMHGIA